MVDAGKCLRTIGVVDALELDFWFAVDVRIANKSWWTFADGHVVLSETLGAWRTRIVIQAWVDALFVDATLIRWTIVVAETSDDSAHVTWVSAVSAQALAFSNVVAHEALSVHSARVVDQARRHAVGIDASLVRFALRIASAANGSARDVGISFVTFAARTDGTMTFDSTFGVCSAVARVSALVVDASFDFSTFAVSCATDLGQWHDFPAFTVVVGHHRLGTRADHRSHRQRVQNVASRCSSARRENCARILASVVDASQFRGTIAVSSTFGLGIAQSWLAVSERISKRQ